MTSFAAGILISFAILDGEALTISVNDENGTVVMSIREGHEKTVQVTGSRADLRFVIDKLHDELTKIETAALAEPTLDLG